MTLEHSCQPSSNYNTWHQPQLKKIAVESRWKNKLIKETFECYSASIENTRGRNISVASMFISDPEGKAIFMSECKSVITWHIFGLDTECLFWYSLPQKWSPMRFGWKKFSQESASCCLAAAKPQQRMSKLLKPTRSSQWLKTIPLNNASLSSKANQTKMLRLLRGGQLSLGPSPLPTPLLPQLFAKNVWQRRQFGTFHPTAVLPGDNSPRVRETSPVVRGAAIFHDTHWGIRERLSAMASVSQLSICHDTSKSQFSFDIPLHHQVLVVQGW